MLKITSVESQKKSASRRIKRYNVYLDGEFAFGADEDLVVNRRLMVGKEILPSDLEQILFEAEVGKLTEKMYRLFNIRQRSEKEVREYFRIKSKEQISQLAIDALVETLKKKGMVNDLEFARSWAESRLKKYGPRRVKQELYQKGIDRETVESIMYQVLSIKSEEEVARETLEKKLRVWKSLEPLEFKKKATEFLMRKGFEYEVVKGIVENIIKKG